MILNTPADTLRVVRSKSDRRVNGARVPGGRRATDAMKMSCPHCGASESAVVRSRAPVSVDEIRRRRECAECGKRFPTSETVDLAAFRRELAHDALGRRN